MAARFEKAAGLFDGFDPKTLYQMVPVRERRGALSVISEAEEIAVAFDTPDIAKFGNKSFNPPSPLPFSDDFVRIQPNSEVKFELVGEKAGNTTLVIKN